MRGHLYTAAHKRMEDLGLDPEDKRAFSRLTRLRTIGRDLQRRTPPAIRDRLGAYFTQQVRKAASLQLAIEDEEELVAANPRRTPRMLIALYDEHDKALQRLGLAKPKQTRHEVMLQELQGHAHDAD